MISLSKYAARGGVGLIAIVALAVLLPQAAHGVVATLVQVVNTPQSPASTLDGSKTALNVVELDCSLLNTPTLIDCKAVSPMNNFDAAPYVVPSGKTLLITNVDVTNSGIAQGSVALYQPPTMSHSRTFWIVAPKSTTILNFSTPIAIAAGFSLQAQLSGELYSVRVRGYLTSL